MPGRAGPSRRRPKGSSRQVQGSSGRGSARRRPGPCGARYVNPWSVSMCRGSSVLTKPCWVRERNTWLTRRRVTPPISPASCSRVSKEPTILHDSDGSGIHERNQLSHRAHKTISRCRELASARQRRRRSARLHTLQLIQAHSSPLAILVTSDDPKDTPYPGAAWSPPIRSSTCRNTSRGTATSAS